MGIKEDVERVLSRSKRIDDPEELKDLVEYVAREYLDLHKLSCDIMQLNMESVEDKLDRLLQENDSLRSALDIEYEKNVEYREKVEYIQSIIDLNIGVPAPETAIYCISECLRDFE